MTSGIEMLKEMERRIGLQIKEMSRYREHPILKKIVQSAEKRCFELRRDTAKKEKEEKSKREYEEKQRELREKKKALVRFGRPIMARSYLEKEKEEQDLDKNENDDENEYLQYFT